MSNFTDFIGGAGVIPPSAAASNTMGQSNANLSSPIFLPMNISALGEFIGIDAVTLTHYDEDNNPIWVVTSTDIGGAGFTSLLTLYWDKVEDRLYALTQDTTAKLQQFAWINTLTGAVTLLSSSFASTLFDVVASNLTGTSMIRAVQGTGNFLITLSNTTGMATLELLPDGSALTNIVSNLKLGNIEPAVNAAYKIDDDLYIGNLTGYKTTPQGVTSGFVNRTNYMSIVSPLGQLKEASVITSSGISLGTYSATTGGVGALGNAVIREWGDDVAIFSNNIAEVRDHAPLFDKTDIVRWARDTAVANGLRVSV